MIGIVERRSATSSLLFVSIYIQSWRMLVRHASKATAGFVPDDAAMKAGFKVGFCAAVG